MENNLIECLKNGWSADAGSLIVFDSHDKEEYCTPKEYELIDYLVTNIDKAISRDELLEKIWGEKNEDSRTVDTHIKQIRAKLTDANIDIQTVRGFGYMLVKKNE